MPQEGWYYDPHDNRRYRWWDGTGWSDQTRPTGGDEGASGPTRGPAPPAAGSTTGSMWVSRPQLADVQRSTVPPGAATSPRAPSTPSPTRSPMFPRLAALLGCLMAFGAGLRMATLSSVAGNSVAEAFYNSLGWAVMGSVLCFAASFSLHEFDQRRDKQRDQN